MQAYERGLRSSDTRLLITPDSEFFRYFADPQGKGGAGAGAQPKPAPQ
jgi:membrane protease subunit HflC